MILYSANEALKAGRKTGECNPKCCLSSLNVISFLGEQALESAKETAEEAKSKTTKKAKEVAEEAGEAAKKLKKKIPTEL